MPERESTWRCTVAAVRGITCGDADWFVAYCPEVPGANGQGRSSEEAIDSLRDASA